MNNTIKLEIKLAKLFYRITNRLAYAIIKLSLKYNLYVLKKQTRTNKLIIE